MEQVTQMRALIASAEDSLVASLPEAHEDLEEFDASAPSSDDDTDGEASIPLRILRKKPPTTTAAATPTPIPTPTPLILLFHGGGFCCGSSKQLTRPGREFALAFNAVVVLATYRKTPEHPFPTPMLDAWRVADWLTQESGKNAFGADPTRGGFILGGFSAGGQIAAVLARQAREKPFASPVTGLYLGIPSMVCEEMLPERYHSVWTSMADNGSAEMNADMAKLILENLQADVKSPWFSPLNSPLGLEGMPPTYVQVGGRDIWRDDGVVFRMALEEAGVEVVGFDRFEEMGHASFTVWAQGEGPQNPVDLKPKMMRGMARLLGREDWEMNE